MTDLHELQLRAFDETAAQAPAVLMSREQRAIVIAAPVATMKMMERAGYEVDASSKFIEIKSADVDRLRLEYNSQVTLDGVRMKVGPIMRDPADPITNVALLPQK
jgi:hypothetical protein